jgi:hypothetical protein
MTGSESHIRGLVARIAAESEGLTGPAMAELCGLVGSAWFQELFRPYANGRGVSTCGLVAEGIWHAAGIAVPSTWRPYAPKSEVEKAIARAIQWASKHNAVVRPGDGKVPSMGDYVVIGEGLRTHALTCMIVDGGIITSVDGGQVAKSGLQTIKICERSWHVPRGKPMVGDRAVQCWIDVSRLHLSA